MSNAVSQQVDKSCHSGRRMIPSSALAKQRRRGHEIELGYRQCLSASISFYMFADLHDLASAFRTLSLLDSFGIFDTAVEASEAVSAGAETSSCRVTLSSQQPLPSHIGSSCCTRESRAAVSLWQASVSIHPDLCRPYIWT